MNGKNMNKQDAAAIRPEVYDETIRQTLPFYDVLHAQAISVVKNMGFTQIHWLDLGCGTGTLAAKADKAFKNVHFVMADPSEKMLKVAREKNYEAQAEYIAAGSEEIDFEERFEVITAVQAHHYLSPAVREKATRNVCRALKSGGIYITFEIIMPEPEELTPFELRRWETYQREQGKTAAAARAHIQRCGSAYFPLTVTQHLELLKKAGFSRARLFWLSYMQAGLYACK